MKTSALFLATLLAATSPALAGDEAATLKFPQARAAAEKATVLDMRTTGSVTPAAEDTLRQTGAHAAIGTERPLGIDVNPWVMPVFH